MFLSHLELIKIDFPFPIIRTNTPYYSSSKNADVNDLVFKLSGSLFQGGNALYFGQKRVKILYGTSKIEFNHVNNYILIVLTLNYFSITARCLKNIEKIIIKINNLVK